MVWFAGSYAAEDDRLALPGISVKGSGGVLTCMGNTRLGNDWFQDGGGRAVFDEGEWVE